MRCRFPTPSSVATPTTCIARSRTRAVVFGGALLWGSRIIDVKRPASSTIACACQILPVPCLAMLWESLASCMMASRCKCLRCSPLQVCTEPAYYFPYHRLCIRYCHHIRRRPELPEGDSPSSFGTRHTSNITLHSSSISCRRQVGMA